MTVRIHFSNSLTPSLRAMTFRYNFAISRPDMPEVCQKFPHPSQSEGAGNTGRSMHPQPRVQNQNSTRASHHGHTGITRHSPRNGFNVYSVLSPVTGSFATVACASYRRLDSSIGKSGPHGFCRTPLAPSSAAPSASIASRSTFVTIASAPLEERDGEPYTTDLGRAASDTSEIRKLGFRGMGSLVSN